MPDRFWVGGTASWDGTAGTKWATSSGGTGGASVPTSADDVYFDAASGAVTVTLNATGTYNCRSLICNGFTGTITGSGGGNIAGGLTLSAAMTWSGTTQLYFTATSGSWSIDTAGRTVPAVTFDGSGGTWTLASALTSSAAITLTRGTFTTNNFNVTASALISNNSNARTINLGSSTVSLSGGQPIEFLTPTNLTFNAGTSQINVSSALAEIRAGGRTFYNVSFTNTTAGTRNGIFSAETGSTFNNLSIAGPASAGVVQFLINAPQIVINGTLSTTGTAGNQRVWIRSGTYGIAQTLRINSAPSLTDADFRDIYVIGTAAPISGTRIGDLRGIRGITASTPKTVYWNLAAGGNWSANAWAASSGGGVSTDNFPLAQDTAIIENTGLNTSATVTLDSAVAYTGTINCATRTNAMSLTSASTMTFYGNLTLSTAVTPNTGFVYVFSGRNTQTITSAGKTLNQTNVDSYGGTVELADALNLGSSTLNVINGTFDTKNFNVTAGSLSSSNSNVRTITLGSSTVTFNATVPVSFATSTNLTLNAGTSQITATATGPTFAGGTGLTFYNLTLSSISVGSTALFTGSSTFNNVSVTSNASVGLVILAFQNNQTINGTLTVAGATAVRRVFLQSSALGTTRTLTVNSLSATDCDFRDITIAGAAAGSSPTRAGDCGGNTGITFPAAKTVYWNLAGAQNWSATAWATGSGGTPDINQFPLAQDTAVFDNTGSAGTITIDAAWNIGTINSSSRSSAMTLAATASFNVYGDINTGSGLTYSLTTVTFAKRGTQTLTTAGKTFAANLTINNFNGTLQLGDALTFASNTVLTLTSGTFDAVSYNVTGGFVNISGSVSRTFKMGSGTWTIGGTSSMWDATSTTNLTFNKSTANIVLSDTSTSARTFAGGGLSYNKLTIGGTTGTSTLTITGDNQFTELASTKTVAHTIALGTTTQTFGKWTVTGTAGNVVTLTGTGTSHVLAGAATSGIDYLAMGSIGFSATSPGEFYAGANSTGTASAPVFRTATPTPRTLYWVGGTGNWSSTTKWSTGSGGSSGAAIPTSLDNVIFNAASNATAYTATIDATSRCNQLTIAGPTSGDVTLAGSSTLICHGNVTFPATGINYTHSGLITFSGSSTGNTFTTNGVNFTNGTNGFAVNGVGCGWSLGSALTFLGSVNIINGSFNTANYNLTGTSIATAIVFNSSNTISLSLGSSTVTLTNSNPISAVFNPNLTFDAGTSTFILNSNAKSNLGVSGVLYPFTFYNFQFGSVQNNLGASGTFFGADCTFNNLTIISSNTSGISTLSFPANVTVNGTFSVISSINATTRQVIQSNTIGTTRTLTCAAVSLTDVDFRDITIAGAAAPASGTRLGDCKGNSGITFTAAKTVYWNLAGSNNWSATGWATSLGGTPAANNFPLAQDTAVFGSASPGTGTTTTINAAYNIGTIDMSARTSNTMTLATGSQQPFIYGNWINGTGTTLSGTQTMTFAGRGSQTITSAGKTFTQGIIINSPGGSVTLQDSFSCSSSNTTAFGVTAGTFDANIYNFTLSSGSTGNFASTDGFSRTLAIGSGTWTMANSGPAWNVGSTGITITGTGTISFTSASAKTFGGSNLYTNITLNQGGAGALSIQLNNTFKDITNTYKGTGAANITLGTTTQTVSQWTGAGEAGRLLTVQGSSASSPGTLILTSGSANVDYLTITGVRAYSLTDTWYAGTNSTNNGSLGWIFAASGGTVYSVTIAETATATDAINAPGSTYNTAISETATITDTAVGGFLLLANVDESASAADDVVGYLVFPASVSETASVSDAALSFADFKALLAESASITDAANALASVGSLIVEAVTASDLIDASRLFSSFVVESATATDSGAAFAIFAVTVTELATITDNVNAPGSTYNPVLAETATATDSDVGFITFPASVDESATGTDEFSALPIYSTNVLETASISDSASTTATFTPVVQESATATDTPTVAPSTFNAPVVEFTTVTDIPSTAVVFQSSLSESATATDVFFGGYLWNPIDDTQTANWQNINNTQTVTWTAISNTQSPGWQDIEEFK